MQNILIAGAVVIVVIGGFLFLQSDSTSAPMDDEMVMEGEMEETTSDEMTEETATDIVATAIATPELSTLVAAVVAADLVETLQSEGPFTVFAPVNAAFAALPAGTVDTLLMEENRADLQGILTYHVVPGKVMSGDLVDGMVVQTVNGESITINVTDAGVTINGSATVALADIETSNGVVHVIDTVLLPPTE
jgi:uncharacterized surface protein with fasciclin (FAS1) repeats